MTKNIASSNNLALSSFEKIDMASISLFMEHLLVYCRQSEAHIFVEKANQNVQVQSGFLRLDLLLALYLFNGSRFYHIEP